METITPKRVSSRFDPLWFHSLKDVGNRTVNAPRHYGCFLQKIDCRVNFLEVESLIQSVREKVQRRVSTLRISQGLLHLDFQRSSLLRAACRVRQLAVLCGRKVQGSTSLPSYNVTVICVVRASRDTIGEITEMELLNKLFEEVFNSQIFKGFYDNLRTETKYRKVS